MARQEPWMSDPAVQIVKRRAKLENQMVGLKNQLERLNLRQDEEEMGYPASLPDRKEKSGPLQARRWTLQRRSMNRNR